MFLQSVAFTRNMGQDCLIGIGYSRSHHLTLPRVRLLWREAQYSENHCLVEGAFRTLPRDAWLWSASRISHLLVDCHWSALDTNWRRLNWRPRQKETRRNGARGRLHLTQRSKKEDRQNSINHQMKEGMRNDRLELSRKVEATAYKARHLDWNSSRSRRIS